MDSNISSLGNTTNINDIIIPSPNWKGIAFVLFIVGILFTCIFCYCKKGSNKIENIERKLSKDGLFLKRVLDK